MGENGSTGLAYDGRWWARLAKSGPIKMKNIQSSSFLCLFRGSAKSRKVRDKDSFML